MKLDVQFVCAAPPDDSLFLLQTERALTMAEAAHLQNWWQNSWGANAPRLLVLDGKASLAAFDDQRLASIGLQRVPAHE